MRAAKGPLIAGGRYDELLTRLGARETIPAVGFAASIEELAACGGAGMSAPLILAVPSKGRLQENAEAFFARSGLELVKPRGAREYRGAIAGFDGVGDRLSVGGGNHRAARAKAPCISASPARIWCAR